MCTVSAALTTSARQNSSTRLAAKSRADHRLRHRRLEVEKRPTGAIDDDAGQRFVERGVGVAVAGDAGPVAERLADRLAERRCRRLRPCGAGPSPRRPCSVTSRSSRPWRPSASSMWSRNGTPVSAATRPAPSRSSASRDLGFAGRALDAVRRCGCRCRSCRSCRRVRSRTQDAVELVEEDLVLLGRADRDPQAVAGCRGSGCAKWRTRTPRAASSCDDRAGIATGSRTSRKFVADGQRLDARQLAQVGRRAPPGRR